MASPEGFRGGEKVSKARTAKGLFKLSEAAELQSEKRAGEECLVLSELAKGGRSAAAEFGDGRHRPWNSPPAVTKNSVILQVSFRFILRYVVEIVI